MHRFTVTSVRLGLCFRLCATNSVAAIKMALPAIPKRITWKCSAADESFDEYDVDGVEFRVTHHPI